MFKKRTVEETEPTTQGTADGQPVAPQPNMSVAKSYKLSSIGPSIRLRGDVEGEEDVIVNGRVEGTVNLRNNRITVGEDGSVNATVNAATIEVEGYLQGDISAAEQVVVRRSGRVVGSVKAPRVTLEDGCQFKGSIDMDVEPEKPVQSSKVTDFKPLSMRTDDETGGYKAS